MQKLKKY
jgi:hypothetical protein